MCYYLNTHTHTLQIVIAGLLRSGDLNMHSSFASSALAFVLGAERSHTKHFDIKGTAQQK